MIIKNTCLRPTISLTMLLPDIMSSQSLPYESMSELFDSSQLSSGILKSKNNKICKKNILSYNVFNLNHT